jgi:pyruvate dehydrogenase E2 component (dihydrolipoamide acetyltransferase)
MARIPIIMPKMSMTMTEGEVATWLVSVGDQVNEGDVIAEVMTDKVDMEVESTHSGTLVEITVEDGVVAVGDPIGYLEGEESGLGNLFGDDDAGDDEAKTEDPAPEAPAPEDPAPEDPAPGDVPPDPPVHAPGSEPQTTAGDIPAAVPRARGLAREHGIDLERVQGSGPDGLVTVSDVEAAIGPSAPRPADAGADTSTGRRKPARDRSAAIRAAVARKMVESASVPQFTVWRDIVLDEADERRQGLSWTTVLLRAYAAALRDVPELLCRWVDDAAEPSGPPSVALAVATSSGLMVPVFSEPDTAAPRELDAEIKNVVADAQQGRLDSAYLAVANSSLSNLGGFGVDRFQALLTPGQASVLALGSIKPRPVAVPGGVGLALTVSAGLTVDHRLADGADAATLLERFEAHLG